MYYTERCSADIERGWVVRVSDDCPEDGMCFRYEGPDEPIDCFWDDPSDDMTVAGVSFRANYPANLLALDAQIGKDKKAGVATLVREPENPHDKNAVMVLVGGKHIGYIPKDRAWGVTTSLFEGKRYEAFVRVNIQPSYPSRPGVSLFLDWKV